MNMKMGIEAALRICFLLFLLSASWQDLKKKTIKKSTFQIWGTVGVILQAAHIFSQIFMEKYAAVIRRSVFMFPGSCLSDDKGKKSEKYRKHPVLAICVSGGTGGPVFMNKRRETVLKDERKKRKSIETEWKGSLTVEASCVMAVVLFSLAALIGKAGQIHDETAAAMVLHEGVEKCRHEKSIRSEDAEAFCKRNAGLMLRYTDLSVSIQEKGAKKMGKVKGGDWEKQIEMKEFRPEEFMRMVTGITGGTNEN